MPSEQQLVHVESGLEAAYKPVRCSCSSVGRKPGTKCITGVADQASIEKIGYKCIQYQSFSSKFHRVRSAFASELVVSRSLLHGQGLVRALCALGSSYIILSKHGNGLWALIPASRDTAPSPIA